MTTIGMHYDVLPGKEQEFKTGFLQTIHHLQSVPGHIQSRLYEDAAAAGSFLILSEWKTKPDFQAFIQSDAFRKVTSWGRAEILRGRPQHKVYTND